MTFVKYFNIVVISILALITTHMASASVVDRKCGTYTYRVKIKTGPKIYDRRFNLYYKETNQKEKLFYGTNLVFHLSTACIKNYKGQYLFLFKETYGGNAEPEDMYGIFDPNTKKLLIKPADWPKGNEKQVTKIIGYSPPLMDDKNSFCCLFSHI